MTILTVDSYVNQEFAVIGSGAIVSLPRTFEDILLFNRELISVDVFLDRHCTRIGEYSYFTDSPRSYADIQLDNRQLINIDHRLSNYSYDTLISNMSFKPVQFGMMEGRRLITTFDEYLAFANGTDRVDIHAEDYKRLQLIHRDMIDLSHISISARGTTTREIDNRELVDVSDILFDIDSLIDNSTDYANDYQRLVLDGRPSLQLSHITPLLTVLDVAETIGDFSISEPPKIEGKLYKLYGTVFEKGVIPSVPTKVMLVDRTGGALTTVSVPVDRFGYFAKYYKDLPDNSSFMIVGLWDVDKVPYYEPTIIDRVIPTLIE
jgi:hypothetical protein